MFSINGITIYTQPKCQFLTLIHSWLKSRRKGYVCVRDVHGFVKCIFDNNVQDAHSHATHVVADGMPIVWLGRMLGYSTTERIYGPDLFLDVNSLCEKYGYSIFLYGSTSNILKRLQTNLMAKFPNIHITGMRPDVIRNGKFVNVLTCSQQQQIAHVINRTRPAIVWVGLGTPKQELWMRTMRPLLHAPILIGVGAAFDFVAGTKKQAPAWMRKIGIEWIFRLIQEPKRLWWRYMQCLLIYPVLCISAVLGEYMYPLTHE